MKREELITVRELGALLGENEEGIQEEGMDEPVDVRRLISLQKAVVLLCREVESLREELQDHFQTHQQQQELMFQKVDFTKHLVESHVKQEQIEESEALSSKLDSDELKDHSAKSTEEPVTYSRVKSYAKIRKRRKSFLEKLFE